jgi:hypothetical protein
MPTKANQLLFLSALRQIDRREMTANMCLVACDGEARDQAKCKQSASSCLRFEKMKYVTGGGLEAKDCLNIDDHHKSISDMGVRSEIADVYGYRESRIRMRNPDQRSR